MKKLDNLIYVCNCFKNGDFDIKEFQSRILTAAIPENLSKIFLRALVDADNMLEEIIFCSLESEFQEHGNKVADSLISAVMEEIEREKDN